MDELAALAHGAHLLALALWVGGLTVALVMLPAGRRVHPADVALLEPARFRVQTVLRWAAIALIATLAIEVMLHTLALRAGDAGGFLHTLRTLLFETRYGLASVARWLLLVGSLWAVDEVARAPATVGARAPSRGSQALGIVATPPRRPRVELSRESWLRIAALLTAGLLVCTAVAGPYGATPLTAIVETLHLTAAMLWLGGTIMIALAVAPFIALVEPARRPMALIMLLNRFTPIAVVSVLVLALTEVWELPSGVHGWGGIFAAFSGVVPALRALVVAVMVAVSAWGVMILRPRLRRLALRAQRDSAAAVSAETTLFTIRRAVWANALLAVVALVLGAVVESGPARVSAAVSPHKSSPTAAARSGSGWQSLGPNVIAYTLATVPAHPRWLFEGTVNGVYRSTDDGAHWSSASNGLAGAARDVLSLVALSDGSLLAATAAGVYHSTDGAAQWQAAGLGTHSIYTLAMHMADHLILLAGGDGGIFRSDDLGVHWHQIYDTGGPAAVTSLVWPAARPRLLVAGLFPAQRPVVISHDGGATWQSASAGMRLPAASGMMTVAVAPGARAIYGGTMGLGAYTLQGLSGAWQERNSGLPGLKTHDAHVGSFAFDPFDSRVVYASTTGFGVYRSADGGRHWAPFNLGLRGDATVVTKLRLVSGVHPVLYAATAAGLYRRPLSPQR